MRASRYFVFLSLSVWPCAGFGESSRVAGFIEELCGPENLIVERDGKGESGLPPLSSIYGGDKISIMKKGGCVRLRLVTDKIVIVEKKEDGDVLDVDSGEKVEKISGSFVVPHPAAESAGFLGGLFDVLYGMVVPQVNYERHAVTVAVRGEEPLELPLLWADENYVVEGSRLLAAAWIGGEAPFAVEIGPEGGPPLVAQENVGGQASVPVTADLAPGPWRVSVRDAGGEVARGAFTVVPASESPDAPSDEGLEAMPEGLRESAYAAWLAEQDEGSWMYEAYLRAGALAGDFAPAGYLERYLASGALWQ